VAWSGGCRRRITRALNDAGIPCPSAADPQRNTHRSGQRWTLATVRSILANPRYTGRQVWNRQPTEHDLIDPANTGLGHRQVQRWNLPGGWIISARPAHPALVSEDDFIAVQGNRAARQDSHGLAAGQRAEHPGCGHQVLVPLFPQRISGSPSSSSQVMSGNRRSRSLTNSPRLRQVLASKSTAFPGV
jgi:Recombinase